MKVEEFTFQTTELLKKKNNINDATLPILEGESSKKKKDRRKSRDSKEKKCLQMINQKSL